ncbi:MAG: YgiQ family radical SAM protein [Myxococcales bacterium]|nr:YgiQ family radical SAM protein [Myxococcales bacterium]MBK7197975.1 YgiQ family radical SAM protein [Myxococcales bacterium]MBP6845317.1 YgiQ family radical SAM protein [Kofleriaceae bacterium]
MSAPRPLFGYRKFWAHRLGPAPFLPTTRAEMDELGWEVCDVVLISGDAYVDHPSFGMAIVGRLLEAQGFRVGIIAQPDWRSAAPFAALGRPALCFGVTAGNMDSMVNRYTSDRKLRSDDAYSPAGAGGLRPDRAVVVYAQRCREAFGDVPVVIGGIEASLRRIAHYDYWSDAVRRSVLVDSHADLLVYGNGERAIVEIVHRLAQRQAIATIRDVRGTAFLGGRDGFVELDSTTVDRPGPVAPPIDPYAMVEEQPGAACATDAAPAPLVQLRPRPPKVPREQQVVRLPAFDVVKSDRVLYAHASRVLHQEANPGNARALVQRHGDRDVWLNPPPLPLTTAEMDALYELPYQRVPHPGYGGAKIPAYEMIRFSVTILRGCFGGCSFCSITEHEGRIIQNRSEDSILREIEAVRDRTPGFHGIISDLGGPTANMWRLACKTKEIEAACRKPSCVFPDVCENMGTDHGPLIQLYRKARALPGVKKVLIASGLRYDLAVKSPAYVKELAQHHTGGYLKIAPEHTEPGPLGHMMKPGIGTYARFKELFDKASADAGKEQYLIPYFIAAHPGTTDEDMLNLALWLKANGFRPDQVQAFLPSPMATATAMYHTGLNPLRSLKARDEVATVKSPQRRRLHKAFLRYHDPANWPMLREALERMGRADLIGNGKHHLVPRWQPQGVAVRGEGARAPRKGAALTQHTGLPPRPRERDVGKRRGR